MAGPIRISILANGRQARREATLTGRAYAGLGRSIGGVTRLAATGLTVGAVAAVAVGRKVVDLASDAQQSIGATETVFKRYADTVVKRSERAARSVGLSANEYRELANVTGAMLKSSEIPLERVTDLTDKLNRRAADVSATFGGTTKEAVEAFTAVLRGETDPVERYGVSIKQADINARLAAKGQDKLTGASLKQAKATAALDLLFRQTADSAGQFAREADTFAGQQQRFNAELSDLGAEAGAVALPALTALVGVARRDLIPALSEGVAWFRENKGEIGDFAGVVQDKLAGAVKDVLPDLEKVGGAVVDVGEAVVDASKPIGSVLLPALSAASDLVGTVADGFSALPDPIKKIGVEAGAAALVLPRLASAAGVVSGSLTTATAKVRQFNVEMSYTATRGQIVQGALTRLGGAAKTAAGIGGLVTLAAGAQSSNKEVGALLTTLGGAATGFSIAGPVGALIGGAGAGLIGLVQATRQSGDEFAVAMPKAGAYAGTLNEVTGATTAATRAMIFDNLKRNDSLKLLGSFGVSNRQAINAILGEGNARTQVVSVLERQRAAQLAAIEAARTNASLSTQESVAQQDQARQRYNNITAILAEIDALDADVAATREKALATQDYAGKLKGLPKSVKTEIRANGIAPTLAGVRDLVSRYKLTPKQVRTAIKASGAELTRKQVANLVKQYGKVPGTTRTQVKVRGAEKAQGQAKNTRRALEDVGKAKADGKNFLQSLASTINTAKTRSTSGSKQVATALEKGPKGARANLSGFTGSVTSGVATARGAASAGGVSVGNALQAGVLAGFAGTAAALAAQASAAVGAAIAAARARAKIKSPSREMRAVGELMGDGLILGMKNRQKGAARSGRSLIAKLLKGVTEGRSGIDKSLERLSDYIDKKVTGKGQGKRQAQILKGLRHEFKQLRKNGQAQEKNARKLEAATQKYKELVQRAKDYAAQVKAGFVDYGNITALGVQEDGSVSSKALVDQLKDRLSRAQRFADLIRRLSGKLSPAALQQLIDKGVDGGLQTAEAIVAGGSSVIAQVNSMTSQLAQIGGTLGDQMKEKFFGAGIEAAEGLIRGLEKQQAKLDRIAERIANRLVAAVKKGLKIKSPSRAFRDIGDMTVKGLALGLDDTYVRRSGERLATSLQKGFGTPALDAYASAAGAGTVGTPIRVVISAEQLSLIEQGRKISVALDHFESNGGRRVQR